MFCIRQLKVISYKLKRSGGKEAQRSSSLVCFLDTVLFVNELAMLLSQDYALQLLLELFLGINFIHTSGWLSFSHFRIRTTKQKHLSRLGWSHMFFLKQSRWVDNSISYQHGTIEYWLSYRDTSPC